MAIILNIDTATGTASLALSKDNEVMCLKRNDDLKDHAAWIHQAIRELLKESGRQIKDLDAIAVTAGPGSYTGLRVGMATAKGLCYALNRPLITENTLKVMAQAGAANLKLSSQEKKSILVPMIDARRMEVFTAAYDSQLNEIMPPAAMVVDAGSFTAFTGRSELVFFGSGSRKFRQMASNENFSFADFSHDAGSLAVLSYQKYLDNDFADMVYTEPIYLKEFYTHTKK